MKVNRHQTIGLAITLLAVSAWDLATASQPHVNLVLIMADDLGYGDLGCYGCPDIRTPNLDRLAKEGTRFTDFYANAAVCSPTRIAFLTGRYQQRFGIENALYYQETGRGLPIEGKTIADDLRAAGYVTGLSGKWHVGYDHDRQPLQQGFDHFFGLLGGNHHYFAHMDRIGVPDLWLGNDPIQRNGYSTDLIGDDAVSFIEANKSESFFLYVSHAAPHFPWQGPGDVDKLVQPKHKSWQIGDRRTYVSMVEQMDKAIGKLLGTIEKLNLTNSTLVVFTSDNGGHTHSRNAPLRGEKATIWEGGTRVPCISRLPGVIPAGEVTPQVAITMDWTATFRRLAGVEFDPDQEDGIDLMPMLSGKQPTRKRTLFWRRARGPVRKNVDEGSAVRSGSWKLIKQANGERYLFDLANDVSESENQWGKHPEIQRDLESQLTSWLARVTRLE